MRFQPHYSGPLRKAADERVVKTSEYMRVKNQARFQNQVDIVDIQCRLDAFRCMRVMIIIKKI